MSKTGITRCVKIFQTNLPKLLRQSDTVFRRGNGFRQWMARFTSLSVGLEGPRRSIMGSEVEVEVQVV